MNEYFSATIYSVHICIHGRLRVKMRRLHPVPKTNLDLLMKEVLSQGRKAALPRNLSDGWLRKIARDLLHAQQCESNGQDDDPSVDLTGPILLVLALRAGGNLQIPLSADELRDELDRYAVALSNEILARQTGVALDGNLRFS